MSEQTAANALSYDEKKRRGLINLMVAGTTHLLIAKKFDPDTGLELTPQVTALDLNALKEARKNAMRQVEEIDLIIADIEGLEKE